MPIPPFALIVTAAGSSSRFLSGHTDQKVKKEFLSIDGHTILYRSLEPFYEIGSLQTVIVTYEKDSLDETVVALEDLADFNTIPMFFTEGGATRAESIKVALEKLNEVAPSTQYVAIQDGARPYTSPRLAIKTFANATVYGASIPGIQVTDTIKRVNSMGLIEETIDRTGVFRVQTPQFFTFPDLYKAYQNCDLTSTDDAAIYTSAGFPCSITVGDEENKKITFFDDIPDAEAQIKEYVSVREQGRASAKAVRRFRELQNMKEDV